MSNENNSSNNRNNKVLTAVLRNHWDECKSKSKKTVVEFKNGVRTAKANLEKKKYSNIP